MPPARAPTQPSRRPASGGALEEEKSSNRAAPSGPPLDERIFPMQFLSNVPGSALLGALHDAQRVHPVREVWGPKLRLPQPLLEYICAICVDSQPEIRQEAVLLLKRYVWKAPPGGRAAGARAPVSHQIAALTCVNLAMKHWQQRGLREQKLHWLSRNSFTRRDFVEAEVAVMRVLGCNVYWEGALLAEWTGLLLHLTAPLFASPEALALVAGVSAHLSDVLCFQDELMAGHWPSELAAAVLHASVTLLTRRLQRSAVTLRVGHLCRATEEKVGRLSERILEAALGSYAEALLETGGAATEESGLGRAAPPSDSCSSASESAEPGAKRQRR
mmetsp:Transcript_78557/g.169747  ORF Transcript_78557/g.169747 Transcript_78557/m.169747 type:complete len:331 (-) Transcript_78557:287-1279(-)